MAAATGLVLSVAQTLLAAMQAKELREFCSIFERESELMKLEKTVTALKATLLEVESKHQELTAEGRDFVEKLKGAVYDIDDLFDEYITVAQQLKRTPGGKLSKKLRDFFSSKNPLIYAFNTSREIKKLRENLDAIAKDRSQFGFSDIYKPVKRIEETGSYVCEQEVIGREVEKEDIVAMLLQQYHSRDLTISFVTIVGFGGLGKTTLAQLVYNDDRVKGAFDTKLWVCVSEDFGIKAILAKMLESITGRNPGDLGIDELQKRVRKHIEGEKYLLVLDDVWSENNLEWLELKSFLVSGGRGSRILVTSRSKKVGSAVDDKGAILELQGLSEEKSWQLFSKIAFECGEDQADTQLIEIGKDIVKKCANVPLSIKVIGSLLRGENKRKWELFRDNGLAEISSAEEDVIMATLKFSYYHLKPELKSCFSFCSLFPKDYVIKKEFLISLWLAQGFLVPTLKGQSPEDVGEEYFSILLHRCFFQDIELDEFGDVCKCKMHDLMHDLALKVAGNESLMLTNNEEKLSGRKIRHLSTIRQPSHFPSEIKFVRTVLASVKGLSDGDMARIVSNCRRLRVLHTYNPFPSKVGKLKHLRYLRLFDGKIKKLPKWITSLRSLQILDLSPCSSLKELPEDIKELIHLRKLDLCELAHMPIGMNELTCLHTLNMFVVGGDGSKQAKHGELKDLKDLVNLRGHLRIKVGIFSTSNMPSVTEGADILTKARLKSLNVDCASGDQGHVHETLLEGVYSSMYPNRDLKKLLMKEYDGAKLPSWASGMSTSLPGLVRIQLSRFHGLQHLPSFSQLRHLKSLLLGCMPNVEYMESDVVTCTFFPSLEQLWLEDMPKLKGWWKDLRWREMEKGGGCLVNDNDNGRTQPAPSFPCLRDLSIKVCSSMKYFPPCPHVKELKLSMVNEALTFCMKRGVVETPSTLAIATNPILCLDRLYVSFDALHLNSLFRECGSSLRNLRFYHVKELKSLAGGGMEHLTNLQSLDISWCTELDMKEDEEEGMPWKCLHSLSYLRLFDLPKLVNLPKGFQFLTSLQSLEIEYCKILDMEEEEGEEGMPWNCLHSLSSLKIIDLQKLVKLPQGFRFLTSLQSLEIHGCVELDMEEEGEEGMPWNGLHSLSSLKIIRVQKLVNLPQGFQFLTSLRSLVISWCDNLEGLGECVGSLTSLQSLRIYGCHKLKSLPESMRHLTSLTTLGLIDICKELYERCQAPHGEDYPNISHIPHITISLTSWFNSTAIKR